MKRSEKASVMSEVMFRHIS
uniref:Uncharacterized protein n=1 Tax=Heterorhabditis bacteriophora TaxID=37862 RepID=A0A1I7WGB9_HETBA